jgi:hypothetical protein
MLLSPPDFADRTQRDDVGGVCVISERRAVLIAERRCHLRVRSPVPDMLDGHLSRAVRHDRPGITADARADEVRVLIDGHACRSANPAPPVTTSASRLSTAAVVGSGNDPGVSSASGTPAAWRVGLVGAAGTLTDDRVFDVFGDHSYRMDLRD